jgi:hypothetical protein
MIAYYGTNIKNFELQNGVLSRYGFRAMFFATDPYLAELYAAWRCKTSNSERPGYVYAVSLPDGMHTLDFGGRFSYTPDFRNLIHRLHTKFDIARIRNVVDSPSPDFLRFNTSDIIVVFNLSLIKSIVCIKENVYHYMY